VLAQDSLVFKIFKEIRLSIQARFVAYWRKREIIRVSNQMFAYDLAHSPVHLHTAIRAQHRVELSQIRAGKLAFIDRRTQANTGIPLTMQRVNQPVVKQTPFSLRMFSRTPIPSRAINIVKAGLLALEWDVEAIEDEGDSDDADLKERCKLAKACFRKPNNDDSFREWMEQLIGDFLVYGMGAAEIRNNPFDNRPVMMWAFNANDLQIVPEWKAESADTMPRYAQVVPGQSAMTPGYMLDEDVMLVRDNIATDTPFGTGCLEIAHNAVRDLLSVQRMAGIAGSDQLGRQIFWWNGAVAPSAASDLRDYLQGELEGMARVGVIAGMTKPDIVDIKPVDIADLLLEWQEMLIRMIAAAFNMSAMSLNVERDVNRATGEVLDDKDFRTAIVPVAKRFQESFTRRIIHQKMGWDDIRFVFRGTEDPDVETKLEILSQRWTSNACTGNDINRALGIKPIKSPFADMTQFELILMQAAMQQGLKSPPQPGGDPGVGAPGTNEGTFSQPAGVAQHTAPALSAPQQGRLSAPKAPAAPTLKQPQLPRLRQFSAEQIANMHPAYIKALQQQGMLPQSGIGLADDLNQEQPNVLQQMSEQAWEYLESLAKHEINEAGSTTRKSKLSKKWTGLAKTRYGKNARRVKQLTPASLHAASSGGSAQKNVTAHTSESQTKSKGPTA
jgi:hypothetical protein